MRIFRKYPYTDFHELNADWILDEVQKAAQETEQSAQQAAEAAATVTGYENRLRAVEITSGAVPGLAEAVSNLQSSVASLQSSVNFLITATGQISSRVNGVDTRLTAAEASLSTLETTTGNLSTEVSGLGTRMTAAESGLAESVKFTEQELSDAQKAQARANIGAATPSQAQTGAVLYDTAQVLSTIQKDRARRNIGAMQTDLPWCNAPLTLISEGSAGSLSDEIQMGPYSQANKSVLALSGDRSQLVTIAGIADPLEDDEAAPKQYVDIQAQPFVLIKTGSDVTVNMSDDLQAPNTIIACGELSSLTITNPIRDWFQLTIRFTSGSTPTTTVIPATILGLESFVAEANTVYEINIMDLRAVVGSWAVSST